MPAAPLLDARAALVPRASLAVLAPLRRRPGIRVGDGQGPAIAWVEWEADDAAVAIRALLPIVGVVLFARSPTGWRRVGRRLDEPAAPGPGSTIPLATALLPAPPQIDLPPETSRDRLAIRLVRGDWPSSASAIVCDLDALERWAGQAPPTEFAGLVAARAGGRGLVVGRPAPAVRDAIRLGGDRVLVPLGYRLEPELPAEFVLLAAGARPDDRLLFLGGGVEVVPGEAFAPLTRASARLATTTSRDAPR